MFHISTCSYSTKYENFAGWNCNFEGKHIRYLGKKSFYTDSDSLHCAQCSPSHSIFGMRMRNGKAQNKCLVWYNFININKNIHWYLDFLQSGHSVTNGTFAARIILSIALVQRYWKETYCIFVTVGMGLMSSVSSQHYQYSEKLWRHPHNHFISNVFVCFLWWLAARGCVCLFVPRIGSHAALPRTAHTLQVCHRNRVSLKPSKI